MIYINCFDFLAIYSALVLVKFRCGHDAARNRSYLYIFRNNKKNEIDILDYQEILFYTSLVDLCLHAVSTRHSAVLTDKPTLVFKEY
jgi:hypothetical protein